MNDTIILKGGGKGKVTKVTLEKGDKVKYKKICTQKQYSS